MGGIPRTVKIVDDILLYDGSYKEHLSLVISVLQKCDKFGIPLNPEKFKYALRKVDYCGFSISGQGYTVDTKR